MDNGDQQFRPWRANIGNNTVCGGYVKVRTRGLVATVLNISRRAVSQQLSASLENGLTE
jgi:hypothetical protein